jgi:hypothetical protein
MPGQRYLVSSLFTLCSDSWGNRRVSNGDQVNRVAALAMKRGKSVDFTGYWQRHVAAQ